MSHVFSLWIIPVAASLLAAGIDFRTGRIPNWLTLPTALAGLVEAGVLYGWAGTLRGFAGVFVCGAVPWLLHRSTAGQGIGGGDVKLFAALGALTGAMLGLEIEFAAFALLAVFALVQLAFRGHLLELFGNIVRIVVRPFKRGAPAPLTAVCLTEMRMGPAIALAVLAVSISEQLTILLPWLA